MSQVSASLAKCKAAMLAEVKATAQGAGRAANAHFAAVLAVFVRWLFAPAVCSGYFLCAPATRWLRRSGYVLAMCWRCAGYASYELFAPLSSCNQNVVESAIRACCGAWFSPAARSTFPSAEPPGGRGRSRVVSCF